MLSQQGLFIIATIKVFEYNLHCSVVGAVLSLIILMTILNGICFYGSWGGEKWPIENLTIVSQCSIETELIRSTNDAPPALYGGPLLLCSGERHSRLTGFPLYEWVSVWAWRVERTVQVNWFHSEGWRLEDS